MRHRRVATALVVAGAALVALVTLLAGPASAHGDTAEFTATRATPGADGTTAIEVLLSYDDGDGVEGAALTVTVDGPGAEAVPVAMAAGDRAGAYTGQVEVTEPGEYTVSASSTDPEAATTFTFTVAPTTTTSEATATSATAVASTDSTTTTEPASDSGSNVASVIANTALLAIGAAAAYFGLRWWRRRRDAGDG